MGFVDWIYMVQDRNQWRVPVNMVMNLRVPLNVEKFLSGCATGGFPRRTRLLGVGFVLDLKFSRQ
jgi:hypothetical protein